MDDTTNWNLNLPPASLAQLCTAKIAISMMNSAFKDISIKAFEDSNENNLEIENILLENMKVVKIPLEFSSYLRDYLIFVLSELRSFYSVFYRICYVAFRGSQLDNQVLSNIAWTGRGEIARDLTATNLAKSGNLNVDIQYRLACTFHLEDLIRRLWGEINPEYRGRNNLLESAICCNESFEVVYWSFEMMGSSTHETFLKYIENKLQGMVNHYPRIKTYARQNIVSERQRVYIYGISYALFIDDMNLARYFAKMCDVNHLSAVLNLMSSYFCLSENKPLMLFYFSIFDREPLAECLESNLEDDVHDMFYCLPSELIIRCYRCFKSFFGPKHFFYVLYSIASQNVTPKDGYISPLNRNWFEVFKYLWFNEVDESYRTYVLNEDRKYSLRMEIVGLINLFKTGYSSSQFDIVQFLLHRLSENRRMPVCKEVIKRLCIDDSVFFSNVSLHPDIN